MRLHPIQPGVQPQLWYQWRMLVRNGMPEEQAWQLYLGAQQAAARQKAMAMAHVQAQAQAQAMAQRNAATAVSHAPPAHMMNGGVQVKPEPGVPQNTLAVGQPQVNGFVPLPQLYPNQSGPSTRPQVSFEPGAPQSTIAPNLIHQSSPSAPAPPASPREPPSTPVQQSDAHLRTIPSPLSSISALHQPPNNEPRSHPGFVIDPDNVLHRGAPIKKFKRNREDSSSIDSPARPKASPTKAKYAAASQLPASPEINWAFVQRLLTPEELRKEKPMALWKHLRDQTVEGGVKEPAFIPDPDQLRAIAVALRNAPQLYLQAVADSERYIKKIADWLMMFIKDPVKWEKAIAPWILVLARTDIPVDYLEDYNIGKRVRRVTLKAEELGLEHKENIKNAFTNFEDWVKNRLIPRKRRAHPDEPATKKPKTEDTRPVVKPTEHAGPSMMNAFAPPPAPAPIRPVARPAVKIEPQAGPSSAGSSKAPLPSFKPKVSSSFQPRNAAPAAPPSTNSLLAKTLQALNKTSAGSVTLPVPDAPRPATASNLPKPNRKGQYVRFRDEVADKNGNQTLREERIFKEEDFELEIPPWLVAENGEHGAHGHTTHELDMDEGKMLKRIKEEEKEEAMEWREPEPYWDEPDPAGITPETTAQRERERAILSLPQLNPPPSPDEAGVKIVQKGPSTVVYSPFQSVPAAAAPAVPNVGALLANLGNLGGLLPTNAAPTQPAYGAQSGYGYNYATQTYPSQSGWGGGGNGYHQAPQTYAGGGGYEREPKRQRREGQSNRPCPYYRRGTCRYTAETCHNLHID